MRQLVIDIDSEKDAQLIEELLKQFKDVRVSSFTTDLTQDEVQSRINEGIKDADEGDVFEWNEAKTDLKKHI